MFDPGHLLAFESILVLATLLSIGVAALALLPWSDAEISRVDRAANLFATRVAQASNPALRAEPARGSPLRPR